jgi:hypothetical protein
MRWKSVKRAILQSSPYSKLQHVSFMAGHEAFYSWNKLEKDFDVHFSLVLSKNPSFSSPSTKSGSRSTGVEFSLDTWFVRLIQNPSAGPLGSLSGVKELLPRSNPFTYCCHAIDFLDYILTIADLKITGSIRA